MQLETSAAYSFDHLGDLYHDGRQDRDAERLGGFHIEHHLKLRRLFNRKIGGFRAFQDFVDVLRGTAVKLCVIRAVADESSSFRRLTLRVDRRQPKLRREFRQQLAIVLFITLIGTNNESARQIDGSVHCGNDGAWRARRYRYTVSHTRFEACEAGLRDGGQFSQQLHTHSTGHCKPAQFARLDLHLHGYQIGDGERYASGQSIGDRRPSTSIGHMHKRDTCARVEQRTREMTYRAIAAGRITKLCRPGLHMCNQFRD